MTPAPAVVALRPRPRVMRARSRAHYSYPKAGCFCSRCVRMRKRENLAALIALYKERLATFERELAELSR